MPHYETVSHIDYVAETFHCDCTGRLFVAHLANCMLNAADAHSSERGFGISYLNSIGRTWVLSRLAIEIVRMPRAHETFIVRTWVESVMLKFTHRCFAVVSPDGEPLAYGRSIWALIDTSTRQPTDILAVRDGLITQYVDRTSSCPIAAPERVMLSDTPTPYGDYTVVYSDIDVNGHLNSVRYIEHVVDLWPSSLYGETPLRRIDINYEHEVYEEDLIHFDICLSDIDSKVVCITRVGDTPRETTVAARVKLSF